MAYIERGYTVTELRQRWQQEAHRLSPDAIVARFGRPPYRWLGETTATTPHNDTPIYAQQARPLLRDQQGRQYTPIGADDPMAADIRLPISITRRQRDPNSRVPTNELQAFPRVGETVELEPLANRRSHSSAASAANDNDNENIPPSHDSTSSASSRRWTMRVRGLENVRTATARVLFHQRLPTRYEIETPAMAAQRDHMLLRRLQRSDTASSINSGGGGTPLGPSIDSPTAEGRALRRFLAIDVNHQHGESATPAVASSSLTMAPSSMRTPMRKRSAAQALGV